MEFFGHIQASPKVSHDMVALRTIGQTAFETYISSKLLPDASTQAPVRKKRLCTFSATQIEKRRVNR